MMSLVLCALAALLTYVATSRDRVIGLAAVLTIGYLYGLLRANVVQTFSHFIFDAAVAGFYLAYFTRRGSWIDARRTASLRSWLLLLIGWPLLLAVLPVQDPIIQLVGLRGAVFLVPFLLVGARLTDEELGRLALWIAALNVAAFVFAGVEYVVGIEPFFPRSAVTELMYRSRDVAGNTAYRIPSSFTSAHAYAATMASTSALIMGVWLSRTGRARLFLAVAMLATLIAVFMAAARTHMIVVAILAIVAALSGRVRLPMRFGFIFAIVIASFVIMSSARLQRFRTLDETSDVTERIGGSVNIGFITLAQRYPMGVGLGGGGTSLPYFLAARIKDRVLIENEYGRIMLEQGIPGLLIWLAFLSWTFSRPASRMRTKLPEVRRLAWVVSAVYWVSAATGTGLLTSVPHTTVLMLYMGWLVAPSPPESEAIAVRPVHASDALVA